MEFNIIWDFVRKNGTLVNKAKSAYGADRWEMPDGLAITLEDDGYTKGIFDTNVKARKTVGNDIIFFFGTEKELKKLSQKLDKDS